MFLFSRSYEQSASTSGVSSSGSLIEGAADLIETLPFIGGDLFILEADTGPNSMSTERENGLF